MSPPSWTTMVLQQDMAWRSTKRKPQPSSTRQARPAPPKGAELTHLSIAYSVILFSTVYGLDENDRCLLAVPMSFVSPDSSRSSTPRFMARAHSSSCGHPRRQDFIDLAARHRITYSLIVPTMFNLCLLAPTLR